MHGGFNEDPKTGIVYTGIPGYGLCAISPDLKVSVDPYLYSNSCLLFRCARESSNVLPPPL